MIGEVLFGLGYLSLCIVVGYITREKPIIGISQRIGFWSGFYASFFLTPLLVFFFLLCVPDRKRKKKQTQAGT